MNKMFWQWPDEEEVLHRCRRLEIELILQKVASEDRPINRILEIGSGDGFQTDYLERLGRVFPSDITIERNGDSAPERFACCSVEALPYLDGLFDLIFSSNVLEHVKDKPKALAELKRVAAAKALLVHVLPTPFWKALADLSYYPLAIKVLVQRIWQRTARESVRQMCFCGQMPRTRRSVLSYLIPPVHGTSRSHWEEYTDFRPATWVRLFREAGFGCIRQEPPFTYSPPAMPLVPPNHWLAEHGLPSCIAYFVHRS